MSEYLFELRCHDMPAEALRSVLKAVGGRLFEELVGRGLGPEEILTGITPRRLMLCCRGLPDREPDREEREIGPALDDAWDDDGEPTEALLGFALRVEVEPAELEEVQTERGTYLAVVRQVAGRPTRDVLAETLPQILSEVRWKPRQRIGTGAWGRPVLGVVSVFDGDVLPFEVDGVVASGRSAGHPVLSPEPFVAQDYEGYVAALGERGIEVSWERRRRRLGESFDARAQELGGELDANDELLDRLTASCEIPGVVSGAFDGELLALPEEVLCNTLHERVGAFTVRARGDLLPFFVTAMDRLDDPEGHVRAGYERAVSARLADLRYTYDRDRRTTLAERARGLDQLSFHPRLGNLAEKTARVRSLVELMAGELGWEDDLESALTAAELAKADLTTDMVRESPRLRGTLGAILARQEGYVESVWQALAEHYRPGSASGPLPQLRSGLLLATADRLDTLVGLCSLGEFPKKGRDPLALRRLTQGLLRMLLEAEMPLDLDLVAARAALLYGDHLQQGAEALLGTLQTFLDERVRRLLGQRGFQHDEIEAAIAIGKIDLPDLESRLGALQTVRGHDYFRSLVLAAKRIANMIKDAPEYELDAELLTEEAEVALHSVLVEVRQAVDHAVQQGHYADSLGVMEALVEPLDRFFAEVLVLDENPDHRQNRIALLQSCRRVFWRIARIQHMVVGPAPED